MGIMTGLTPDIDVKRRAVTSFRSGILVCSSFSKECYQVKDQRTQDSGSGPATANRSLTGNGWRVMCLYILPVDIHILPDTISCPLLSDTVNINDKKELLKHTDKQMDSFNINIKR